MKTPTTNIGREESDSPLAQLRALTHVAKKDRPCITCGDVIPAGAKYRQYREVALSSHEACHAGGYPIRRQCARCAGVLK